MSGEYLDNHGRGSASWRWPSVHPEGRKFGAIVAAMAALAGIAGWSLLAWPLVGLTVFVLAFFRDPLRVVPQGPGLVIAPADGLVTLIQRVAPPRELTMDDGSGTTALSPAVVTRVSIFMSVFDVHINRAAIGGTVRRVIYIAVGQRVGLIRFGSRVDVYLPEGADSLVLLGQKVVAGETVLAEVGRQLNREGLAQ